MKYFNLLVLSLFVVACTGTENKSKIRIGDYLKKCEANGVSGSVLVAQKGEVLFSGGIGFRDKEQKLTVTKETVFTTGSLTKQFTATAILRLADEGKLTLEDNLTIYFQDVPEDKKDITIQQLLTHSSGLIGDLDYGVDFVPINKKDFIDGILNAELNFQPGTGYRYANAGYSLLAIIIEKVTQTDYETYLQTALFSKAGMKNTGYLMPDWDKTNIARGYKCGEDWGTHIERWEASSNVISWHLKGNGGILSTPEDLYKWYLAIKEGRIIKKESIERMFYPHVPENENGDSFYGYGWAIFNSERNTKIVAHNGSNGVFYADFIQLPEEDAVIIYMTNQLRYDTQVIGWEIEKLLFDESYKPVIPKMKYEEYASEAASNKNIKIINEFVSLILMKEDIQTPDEIDAFIRKYIPNETSRNRYKRFFQNMREDFVNHKLKHILEYKDMTYDIVLESPEGQVTDLAPCFDLKFNDQNQIIAFGW
ncbi:MAG: serine hydrolase domain-containing protein [Calditrichaceae bacterium]